MDVDFGLVAAGQLDAVGNCPQAFLNPHTRASMDPENPCAIRALFDSVRIFDSQLRFADPAQACESYAIKVASGISGRSGREGLRGRCNLGRGRRGLTRTAAAEFPVVLEELARLDWRHRNKLTREVECVVDRPLV